MMGRCNVGYLLVVIMFLLVTEVDGRRGGGGRSYRYRSGYSGGGSTGGASSAGLNSGAIIGMVTGIVGIGICMRYLPLRGYTST